MSVRSASPRILVGGQPYVGPMTTPDVIRRYYAAASDDDLDAIIACFAPSAHVLDEDQHYRGIPEIRRWRERVASRFTYSTQVTEIEQTSEDEYVVATHLEGDFPGGVVDLKQRFTVRDGLIAQLLI